MPKNKSKNFIPFTLCDLKAVLTGYEVEKKQKNNTETKVSVQQQIIIHYK